MECLKFDLLGKSAFFKNPEVNNYREFSFSNIHKPALLGILGAIIGLGSIRRGKNQNVDSDYYNELHSLKIAIAPKKTYFDTYKEINTNTNGFTNKDGNSFVLRRQILNNPIWTIYVLQNEVKNYYWDIMKDNLKKHESVFPIYLGNNNHPANIDQVEIIDVKKINNIDDIEYINSLFNINIIENLENQSHDDNMPFCLEEYLPLQINTMCLYNNLEKLCFTNLFLKVNNIENLYSYDNLNLYFI